jgi:site-specific DNA-methyltransferase (adenine-specific)
MKNQIYYGDNLEVLRKYIQDESIDLCYIDPPFNSKRNYNQIYKNLGEDKASAQAFTDTWEWNQQAIKGLSEIKGNYNGIFTEQIIELITGLEKVLKQGSLFAYLVSMTLRIAEIHRSLKETGSFYLHCDPTASHYLKLVCDAIFCAKGGDFRNEIVWCYSRMAAKGQRQLSRCHDVIFWYSKGKKWLFNVDDVRLPYSPKSKARAGYKKTNLGGGKPASEICELNEIGKFPEDWIQIPFIRGKEYLGYPTQKPEALLERIIKASSNEGDVILDAYCGCGTTIAVAEKLKRKWIGIDITYQSISVIIKRFEDNFGRDFTKDVIDPKTQKVEIPATVEMKGIPKDFESAVALANREEDRTRKEFEKWIILTYSKNRAIINEKKGSDKGIDGIVYISDRNETGVLENKKALFSVKSNKTLTPSVIRELNGTIERENAACGFLLTLYPMPNLVKESRHYGVYQNKLTGNEYPKIQVVSVEEVLKGETIRLPHTIDVLKSAEFHQKPNEDMF